MTSDVFNDPSAVHCDDGVRFGTAAEMIAEIKRLRTAALPLARQHNIDKLRDRYFGDALEDTETVWISVRAGEIRRAADVLGVAIPAELASPAVPAVSDDSTEAF